MSETVVADKKIANISGKPENVTLLLTEISACRIGSNYNQLKMADVAANE